MRTVSSQCSLGWKGWLCPFPLIEGGDGGGRGGGTPVTRTPLFSLQRAEDYGPVEVISHWHPNLTINMVDDHTPWVKGSVPPPLDQCKGQGFPGASPFLRAPFGAPVRKGRVICPLPGSSGAPWAPRAAAKEDDGDDGSRRLLSPPSVLVPPAPDVKFDAISGDYYPILYFNDYWNLQKDYFPINESLRRLPFRLSFCPLSLWRWQLYAAQSTKSPWNFLGEDLYEQSDEEQDSVKVSSCPACPPGAPEPSPSERSAPVLRYRSSLLITSAMRRGRGARVPT